MRLILLLSAALLFPQDETREEKIEELIEQLDAESLILREEAMDALTRIGLPALEALERAAKGDNTEVVARSKQVLKFIRTAEKLKKVYPAPKRVTLDQEDAPLSGILEELRKQTGMDIKCSVDEEQKVSLNVREATPFDVLDRICRQLKNTMWKNEEAGEIRISKGEFPNTPAAYAENFRFTLSQVETTRTTDFKKSTGQVAFYLTSQAEKGVNTDFEPYLEVTKVIDANGKELEDALADAMGRQRWAVMRQMGMMGGAPEGMMFVYKNLGKDVKRIKAIRGTARYFFPLEEAKIEFDTLTRGTSKTAGDFTLTVTQMSKNYVSLTITSKATGVDLAKVINPDSIEVYDKDDKKLQATANLRQNAKFGGIQAAPSGNSYSFYIMVNDPTRKAPVKLNLTIIKELHTKEVPFEIKNVEIP